MQLKKLIASLLVSPLLFAAASPTSGQLEASIDKTLDARGKTLRCGDDDKASIGYCPGDVKMVAIDCWSVCECSDGLVSCKPWKMCSKAVTQARCIEAVTASCHCV